MRSVLVILLLSFFTVSSVSACNVAPGACAPGMTLTKGSDGCQICTSPPKCPMMGATACAPGTTRVTGSDGCPTCKPNTNPVDIYNSASSCAPQALALGSVALAAALF